MTHFSTIILVHLNLLHVFTPSTNPLCLGGLKRIWETAHVVLEGTLVAKELDVGTVDTNLTSLTLGDVFLTTERSEAPVLGDDDLLATRELVLRSAEGLDGCGAVRVLGADREDDLANVDTGNKSVWLSERSTHSSLQSIGSGT